MEELNRQQPSLQPEEPKKSFHKILSIILIIIGTIGLLIFSIIPIEVKNLPCSCPDYELTEISYFTLAKYFDVKEAAENMGDCSLFGCSHDSVRIISLDGIFVSLFLIVASFLLIKRKGWKYYIIWAGILIIGSYLFSGIIYSFYK